MIVKIFVFLAALIPQRWKRQIKIILRAIVLDVAGDKFPENSPTRAEPNEKKTIQRNELSHLYFERLKNLKSTDNDLLQSLEELNEIALILNRKHQPQILRSDPSLAVKVSIVIPVYSNHDDLSSLLDHLNLVTTFGSFEVIVVNDHPGKPLPSRLLNETFRFPFTIIQNQWNTGYPRACNLGASHAKGEHFLFLNSDVFPKNSDWLDRMVETMEKSDDRDVVGAKTLYYGTNRIEHFGMFAIYEPVSEAWRNAHYFHRFRDEVWKETMQPQAVDMVSGVAMLVRASAFQQIGGFDEKFVIGGYEDSDLCHKIRKTGGTIYVAAQAVLYHRKSASLAFHPDYGRGIDAINEMFYNHRWADSLRHLSPRNMRETGSKLRILFVANGAPPESIGGTELYNFNIARAVGSGKDFDAILLVRGIQGGTPEIEGQIFPAENEAEQPQIFRCMRPTVLFVNEHAGAEIQFEIFLRSLRPDIIHFNHTEHLSLNFIRIAKMCGVGRIVYTLHEFLPICANNGLLVTTDGSLCSGPETRKCAACVHVPVSMIEKRNDLYRENFAYVDLFIAPSQQLRRKYMDWGLSSDRIVYSRNGIHLPMVSKKKIPGPKTIFCFIGQIGPHKGVSTLLEAAKLLFRKSPGKFEIHIHGTIQDFPPFFSGDFLQKTEELRDCVTYYGPYPNEAVGTILQDVDAVIVPSSWWENSPLTIQEAFSCSVPVITCNIGGMKELVQDGVNGLLFEFKDARDLSAKMKTVMDQPELLNQFRENLSKEHLKTIEENAIELAGIYRSLLQLEPVRIPLVKFASRSMNEAT